jgi:6-pyruvoyltetrahydropterin/6-carboxytetrahydropterin synthase
MFTIGVRSSYEAAHFLRNYAGDCARLHGHRYEVEAVLSLPELDDGGLAYDFVEFDRHLEAVTRSLDHQNLNDLEAFSQVETTAENQARYIYFELKSRLGGVGDHLHRVRVWETARHWAEFSELDGPR